MNRRLKKQLTEGSVLLINKQAGRTSHDEVGVIKYALKAQGLKVKVGHSGTLDPKVTGLLVVGLGKGTKVLEYVLLSEKRYIGEIIFHQSVTRADLDRAIEHFTGKINQLPPRKSAVKRRERTREVYRMKVLKFNKEKKTALIDCAVERGTYIRKLFHDMGEYLGIRAHMGDLHRTHVGPFEISDDVITSDVFAERIARVNIPFVGLWMSRKISKSLLPLSSALGALGLVKLHPGIEQFILSGGNLYVPGIKWVDDSQVGDKVAVHNSKDRVVAIGDLLMTGEEIEGAERGIAVATKKILI